MDNVGPRDLTDAVGHVFDQFSPQPLRRFEALVQRYVGVDPLAFDVVRIGHDRGFGNGLDLGQFSLNTGIQNTGAYVDYVLDSMGAVPTTPEARAEMIAYMEAPRGINSLSRRDLDMKTRGLIHLIMSTAEYQMA